MNTRKKEEHGSKPDEAKAVCGEMVVCEGKLERTVEEDGKESFRAQRWESFAMLRKRYLEEKEAEKEKKKRASEEEPSVSIKKTLNDGETEIPLFKEYNGSYEQKSKRALTILRHTIPEKKPECIKVGRWVSLNEVTKWGVRLLEEDVIGLCAGKGSHRPPKIIFEMIKCVNDEIFMRLKDEKVKPQEAIRKGFKWLGKKEGEEAR